MIAEEDVKHVEPLTKQDLIDCYAHYVSKCGARIFCQFSHDYALTPWDVRKMKAEYKSIPCRFDQQGACSNGKACKFGHKDDN